MPRKTEFEMYWASGAKVPHVKVSIIGQEPDDQPYVSIDAFADPMFLKRKDLERFAVNILKALGSKKLASHTDWKRVTSPRKKIKK